MLQTVAVGMATNIPSHNLGEVMDACMLYIDNPEVTLDELLEVMPGPDFPTGGTILGRSGIRSAFATGRGSIVDEMPYQVNKVKEKRIDSITEIRNESDKSGIREINLRRNAEQVLYLINYWD